MKRLLLILRLFVLAAMGLPAAAQGTGGLLPDPISTGDLVEWFEELDCTREEREAVLALHDEYLAQCKSLREGRIQSLLDLEEKVQPRHPAYTIANERDVRRFMRDLESIQQEFERLDGQLVDGMREALAAADPDRFNRIRGQRERVRLLSDPLCQVWVPPFWYPEVRGLAPAAKLAEEEVALIEPIVREYERQFALHLARLITVAHRHLPQYREALNEAGLNLPPDARTPASAQAEQRIWQEMMDKPQAAGRDVARLRAKFIADAAAALPVDAGHAYRLAYNSGGGAFARHDSHGFRLDLEFEHLLNSGLTDGEREQILQIRSDYRRQWGSLHNELTNAIADAYGGVSYVSSKRAEEQQAGYQIWADEWSQRCEALAGRIRAQVAALIGPERAEDTAGAYDRWRESRVAQNRANEPDQIIQRSPAYKFSFTQTSFLPPQITRTDFNLYAHHLGLAGDKVSAAQERFNHYLVDLRSLAAERLDGLYYSSVWTPNPSTGELQPPSLQEFEVAEGNRDQMMEAMNMLHGGLLDDLRNLANLEPEDARFALIELHRTARSLAQYVMPDGPSWLGYTEVQANIAQAVLTATLTNDVRAAASEVALGRSDMLIGAWRAHLEAQRTHALQSRRSLTELAPFYARQATIEEIIQTDAARRKDEAAKAVVAARRAVVDLNRAILAEIEAVLDERQANALRLAYLREAYPTLFEDPAFDESLIPRAMKATGVTDAQRIELAMIEWEHAKGYTDLSMQMCDILRESASQGLRTQAEHMAIWADERRRSEQVDCLKFYRSELTHRARVRVWNTLTEEQWAALNAPAPSAQPR